MHELEEFYKTDLSFLTITFGKKRIFPYTFLTLYLLLSLAILVCWLVNSLLWTYILMIILLSIVIFYFGIAKALLRKKYEIKTRVIPDFYQAVRELRLKRMKKFLLDTNLISKCDKLLVILQKKADSSKISPIFNTGIFLILILPIWEQIITQLTTGVDIFQLKNFIYLLSFTVVIYSVIWMIKLTKDSVLELLDIKSQKYNVMIDLIEEISLTD